MTGKYEDADTIVSIEGREYALYKNGPLNKYPYMVDISTGEVPLGKQRSLLRSYLWLKGIDIESLGERGPHWYVRQAIKVAQGRFVGATTQSAILNPYTRMSNRRSFVTPKDYLSLTEENIEDVHQQVLATPDYGSNFSLIHDALKRFPQNIDRELVAMKVALIDLTNSTHISTHIKKISLSEIVELILNIRDFDVRVSQGDPLLVSQLAISNGRINLFSFASQYCTYHNVEIYGQDNYSIFDSVVKVALPHYIPKLTKSTIEEWRTTCNYVAFNNCIEDLLNQKNIHIPLRRRKFDHFLWYLNRKK